MALSWNTALSHRNPRGRGSRQNTANRFEHTRVEHDPMATDEAPALQTEIYDDKTHSILSKNDSPDVPFTYSVNPYRGCEHGCVYCYARPTHEYLGFSAGLDFESRIVVKREAARLLAKQFESKSWQPQTIAMSGNTDCYQPLERDLEITRQCLEVFLKYKNPVSIITKNQLILRDLDILSELAKEKLVSVHLSITTLNPKLARILEPRASQPESRLETIKKLADNNIPVGVMLAPVIPALNDMEIPNILRAAREHGATSATHQVLRLPLAVKDLFADWLDQHFPERKAKVMSRLLSLRHNQLNSSRFGERMKGTGAFAAQIAQMFDLYCAKHGFNQSQTDLDEQKFERPVAKPNTSQMSLWA